MSEFVLSEGAELTAHQRAELIRKLNGLWARRERVHLAESERARVDAEIEGITNVLRANPRNARRKGDEEN